MKKNNNTNGVTGEGAVVTAEVVHTRDENEAQQQITVHSPNSISIDWESAVENALEARAARNQIIDDVLVENVDYGPGFPGSSRKCLLLPGAQQIANAFQLYPDYVILEKVENWDKKNPLFYYQIKTLLRVRGTDNIITTGVGSANSRESKWAYRKGQLCCPECGMENIKKSKPPRKNYYCWKQTGGCGANFNENDTRITEQKTGRVKNEDICDLVNTILKVAKKRSFVDASVNLGLSHKFTQDADELPRNNYDDGGSEKKYNGTKPTKSTSGKPIDKKINSSQVMALSNLIGDKDEIRKNALSVFKVKDVADLRLDQLESFKRLVIDLKNGKTAATSAADSSKETDASKPKISKQQEANLTSLIGTRDSDKKLYEKVLAEYKIKSLGEMLISDYDKCVRRVKKSKEQSK